MLAPTTTRSVGFAALFSTALLVLAASPALAQDESKALDEPPEAPFERHVLYYSSALASGVNPLGLASISRMGYRLNLFDSDNALLGDTFVSVALAPYVSPAFARGGLEVKLKPLAVLELTAIYDLISYFGNFGHVQSFDSPTEDASDDRLDEREAQGLNNAIGGSMLTLQSLLQAKVGPIAVRSFVKGFFIDMDLPAGDTVFYEPSLDILVPDDGLTLSTDTDLLVVSPSGFTLGLRHTFIRPLFDDDDFREGESTEDPNGPIHRLGPLLAYKFNLDKGTHFDEPTAFLLVHWYLKHRFRAGQESSQLFPYIAFGFAFSGHVF